MDVVFTAVRSNLTLDLVKSGLTDGAFQWAISDLVLEVVVCIVFTVYIILYTAYCILYVVYYILCTVHCILYVYCILSSLPFTVFQSPLYSAPVSPPQCSSLPSTVFQSPLYSAHVNMSNPTGIADTISS